jgi:glycosyltransferase involved in cell wall biosynthesis
MDRDSRKVSIVLPTYNGSRFLRGAIDSCLSQTHRDLELIVVDDTSTDSTPDIIRSYEDPRLVRVRNAKNRRLPKSLNIGFGRAKGDYLTWTSDDNEYEPDAIERMLGCLESNPGADFVYADYWALDEKTGKKELVRLPGQLNLGVKNEVGACFLYTRRVYERTGGYNPNYEMVEDYDYWMRICRRFGAVHCARPLYLYRYHAASLTSTRAYNQDLFDIILKNRSGYRTLLDAGWTGLYYFENVRRSPLVEEEKKRLIRQTMAKVARLSPAYYALFRAAVLYCAARRGLKRLIKGDR